MAKKKPQPKEFAPPAEVVEADPPLPKELAKQGPLTLKEKKKHEKRRDQLMAHHGTAARLSNEDQALIHARISSGVYRVELDRLLKLRTQPTPKGGLNKRELERVIKATANNLSDALREQGDLAEAYAVLVSHDRTSKKFKHITELGRAHARPDYDHCECPASGKSVSRVFSIDRGEFVDLVKCDCGHMNATTQLPVSVLALQKARGQAEAGAEPGQPLPQDSTVLKHAERLVTPKGGR